MSDSAVERGIAEHWALIGGLVGFVTGILIVGRSIKRLLREEISDGVLLSLQNGAGKEVHRVVHGAVTDAMTNHIGECPMRARVDAQHDRLLVIEESALREKKP